MAEDIFQKMAEDWTLGKFFPASMNPYYFNDTIAYLIDDSFTKEEVEAEWFLRRDEEIKVDIPEGSEVVKAKKDEMDENDKKDESKGSWPLVQGRNGKYLSDYQWFDANWNRVIDPEILKKVVVDEKGNSYRIIKMEYDFLMKYWLPLPELHWLDRIKLGFRFK